MSGIAGKTTKSFSEADSEKAESVIERLTSLISNTKIDKKETKTALNSIQDDIINLIGADNNITIKSGTKK